MHNGGIKMSRENYWRISHGYEPHEPTNTFSFYKKPFCFAKAFTKLLEKFDQNPFFKIQRESFN